MSLGFRPVVAAMIAILVWLASPQARADAESESLIRAALEQWRQDFNARKSANICDLFAKDLLYDFQGLPEQNYTLLCDRLHKALAGEGPDITYGLTIKEVIVSGDLAVVRLTWISTVTATDGTSATDEEQGLDVFAKGPDGKWRIIRYIAYAQ
jgi:steroid delta-isomerase